MVKNMGKLDKTLRIAVAAVIAILYFTHVISGTLAIVLGIVAIIFLLTSLDIVTGKQIGRAHV